MRWFRVYDEVLDDPKIQRLPIEIRWRWLEVLCVASRQTNRGSLPDLASMAFHFRVGESEASNIIRLLVDANLIEKIDDEKWRIHGWDNRQFKSDDATERWRKHRDSNSSNVCANVGTHEESNGGTAECANASMTTASSDPEIDRIANLASDLAGDVSWSFWVSDQAKLGHPCHAIEEALTACVNKGKWDRGFAGGVLKRLCNEGYPNPEKRGSQTNGKPRKVGTPESVHQVKPRQKPDEIPMTPEQKEELAKLWPAPRSMDKVPSKRTYRAASKSQSREAINQIAARVQQGEQS